MSHRPLSLHTFQKREKWAIASLTAVQTRISNREQTPGKLRDWLQEQARDRSLGKYSTASSGNEFTAFRNPYSTLSHYRAACSLSSELQQTDAQQLDSLLRAEHLWEKWGHGMDIFLPVLTVWPFQGWSRGWINLSISHGSTIFSRGLPASLPLVTSAASIFSQSENETGWTPVNHHKWEGKKHRSNQWALG